MKDKQRREFWIIPDKKDIQTFEFIAHEEQHYDDDIHAVEITNEEAVYKKADVEALLDVSKSLIGKCVRGGFILNDPNNSWHYEFTELKKILDRWEVK